jgi:hypothetical protein
MDEPENQHYVSQVLQRRFADGPFLQRFDLKWKKWRKVSTAQIFSRLAYAELFAYGEHDNSLDNLFKTFENALPETLKALDEVAKPGSAELLDDTCSNLFWYCAFLWRMSPFIKAIAPLEYALDLDLDLKRRKTKLVEILGINAIDVSTIRLLYAQGKKFIPVGENSLQLLFRIQFWQRCDRLYIQLRHFCKWTLYSSPIILPIADSPFFSFLEHGAPLYIFTISPRLVLIGKQPVGTVTRIDKVNIESDALTNNEAEYIRDAICLSALTAVASRDRSIDVLAARKRAKENGVSFPIIKNLDSVLSAGLKECTDLVRILPVTETEFATFKRSFVETHD